MKLYWWTDERRVRSKVWRGVNTYEAFVLAGGQGDSKLWQAGQKTKAKRKDIRCNSNTEK